MGQNIGDSLSGRVQSLTLSSFGVTRISQKHKYQSSPENHSRDLMEYDRIDKTGILSPSKLRMKLMGTPNQKKKDGSNSSRTSPARMEDSDFVKNSLLEDSDYEVQSGTENVNVNCSAIHPVKTIDDDTLDYDSNASSSSFEFHKGERAAKSLPRSFSRTTSYKWNDAEKWIVNMNKHCNYPKGHNVNVHPQGKRIANLYPQTKSTSGIREVSMRDTGTEMTPNPSQEPSRTPTPVGATTPLRSPTSSPNKKRELLEEEQKAKTRREIVALGVQLGKMNIAAWASKDEQQTEDLNRLEYEKRAAAWEEAEKSKHAARFKGKEIKIQAWESEQKIKLEEEMKRIEAKVEEMRAEAQAKMRKKIEMARKRSDEKRVAAEARKTQQAERTAAEAECIRQTGRMPQSHYICCGLF